MRYLGFSIENYRAIEDEIFIDISKSKVVPLVGVNECGKTTILQAIYCFDSVNDEEYNGKHLKDTKNLYHTVEKGDPLVTATIEMTFNEFKERYIDILNGYNQEKKQKQESEEGHENDQMQLDNKIKSWKEKVRSVKICRNLTTKEYKLLGVEVPNEINSALAKNITLHLPYIVYNDDFMDRPPNFLEIPETKPVLTGWLAIFERLFQMTSPDYSLFNIIKEEDTRRRDAILSDVEDILNTTIIKSWKQFDVSSQGSIRIKLQLNKKVVDATKKITNILEIKIVEQVNTKERYFDVIDRSKGFLWFFNFVMKLEFNPKVLDDTASDTVHLLDEPGSYLHYSAQEKLCQKLVNLSKKNGPVIYCTHSHTLLNPDFIPINSIYIIGKDRAKKVNATLITKVKTKAEHNISFQPIHEALQLSSFDYNSSNKPILVVEGIYDKYSIQLMIKTSIYSILPSTSANSILRNIQFLNGFHKHYIVIWDNDDEGRKNLKEGQKLFGEVEATKFDLLPSMGRVNRRMEEMFEPQDLKEVKAILGLDNHVSYERAIVTWYYSDVALKDRIKKKLSPNTIERFKVLESVISKRFEASNKTMQKSIP